MCQVFNNEHAYHTSLADIVHSLEIVAKFGIVLCNLEIAHTVSRRMTISSSSFTARLHYRPRREDSLQFDTDRSGRCVYTTPPELSM